MTDIVTAKVRNKDRLFKKLGELQPATFEVIKSSNRQAAEEMAQTARSFAPVKTGRLRDSIVVTGPGGTPPGHSQGGGAGPVPEGSYAVSAGNSGVRYGHLVEFGTQPHPNEGMFPGTENPGAKAQPFFWPAWRLVRKGLRAKTTRALNKAVKKVAGK